MATDLERLVVQLSADIKGYENAMNRAQGVTNRSVRNIQNQFARANRQIAGQFTALGRSFAGAFAAGVSVQGAKTLLDASIRIQNALKVTGLEGAELASVYDKLYAAAQRNAAPLESLVTLYGRVALVQNELGVSSGQLITFADNVALSLRVAGTDAAASSGALLQLSQALGSGVVRAEEFNSILEGAPTILQAAAAGISEAGGSVAKLRQIMLDGELSSKALFDGFNAGSSIMEDRVAGAAQTVSQRLERLQNVLIDAAGRFNEASSASDALGGSIDALADFIASIDMGNLIAQIDNVINKLAQGEQAIYNFAAAFGQAVGLDKVGEMLTNNSVANSIGLYSGRAVDRRMSGDVPAPSDAIKDYISKTYGGVAGGKTGRVPEAKEPLQISVKAPQYAVPAAAKSGGSGGGGGGRRSRGGGGGGAGRQDELAREIQQIKERTAATLAETKALAGINPLINDYGYAVEKARTEQDLLTAAQKAGKQITPQLRAEIATLAEGYAAATVEAQKLEDAQDAARDRVREFNDVAKDTLGGFIQDLKNGVSGAEALQNAIGRLADSFLNSGLDALFSNKSGGGGLFGSLFSGLLGGGFKPTPNGFAKTLGLPGFASGTANTGGRTGQVRGLVHGNEAVIPLPNGGKVPVTLQAPQLPRFGAGGADNRTIKVEVAADVDNSGNITPFVTKVADERANAATARGQQQAQRTFPAMQADRQRRYS